MRADKSKCIYKIIPSNYHRIQQSKITDTNKLDNTLSEINNDTAKIASKQHVNDRKGKLMKRSAYILFKNHKPNFHDKQQSRLINPSKTELDQVVKKLLQNIIFNVQKDSVYSL